MQVRGEEDDDSSDDEPEHSTYLLVGRSNTGKSSLLKSLLKPFKEYQKPIYILNNRSRKKSPYIPIAWSQLGQVDHAALIVEDVVQATTQQYRQLGELLSVSVHHKRINPVLIVVHSILKQNIWSLVAFFTRIYITACPGNIGSLEYLLTKYGFTKEEKLFHVQNLLNNKQPYAHFLFDVDKHTIEKVHFELEPDETEAEKGKRKPKKLTMSARDQLAQSKALRYLSVLDNEKQAMACWDLLYAKLRKNKSVCPETLEITLQQKKGERRPVVVSLIHYIAVLVDDQGKVPVGSDIAKFHKYCQTVHGIRLPPCYVLNKSFRD